MNVDHIVYLDFEKRRQDKYLTIFSSAKKTILVGFIFGSFISKGDKYNVSWFGENIVNKWSWEIRSIRMVEIFMFYKRIIENIIFNVFYYEYIVFSKNEYKHMLY